MTITIISKPLENGHVQVDAKYKNGYKRYYKVPGKYAKRFSADMEKQDKNLNLCSDIVFWGSIFLGVAVSAYFTRHLDSRLKQFLIQTLSAVGLTGITSYGMSKYIQNEHNDLLNHYKAKEIHYRA